MLKPDDLIAIACELHIAGIEGLANEVLWLSRCPKTMTPQFKKAFPDCYKALRAPLKDVPTLLSEYPIIAKYRLKYGR